MTQKVHFILLTSFALALAACGGKGSSTNSSSFPSPTPTPVSSPSPSPTPVVPFEAVVTSTYETGGASTTEADCQIPSGAAVGSVLACTNTLGMINGTVAIPEGRLYFSKLTFTLSVGAGSASNGCTHAVFAPYWYLVNNSSNKFSAPWTSGGTVDCTTNPPAAGCYGGLAVDLISGFPNYKASYFLVAATSSMSWTAQSANSHTYLSNRFSVNNLATRTANITFTHAQVLGDGWLYNPPQITYQDYEFECLDQWEQPVYAITLTLTDEDINGVYPNASQNDSTKNQFPDWDPAAWDR